MIDLAYAKLTRVRLRPIPRVPEPVDDGSLPHNFPYNDHVRLGHKFGERRRRSGLSLGLCHSIVLVLRGGTSVLKTQTTADAEQSDKDDTAKERPTLDEESAKYREWLYIASLCIHRSLLDYKIPNHG
jgi:hypothetical protein